jgi:hypothetical protein
LPPVARTRAVRKSTTPWRNATQGEFIIPLHFDSAYTFQANGLAPVKVNGKFGYIDEKGEFVIPPHFDGVRRENYAANNLMMVGLGDKWGYIDQKGKFVIPPQFAETRFSFANGLAGVKVNDKYGYICIA